MRFSWGRSRAPCRAPTVTFHSLLPPRAGHFRGRELNISPGTVSNPSAQAALQWIHKNFNPMTINEAHVSWLRSGANAQVFGARTENYGDTIGIPNANVRRH